MAERTTPVLTEGQVAEILPQGKTFRFVGEVLEMDPGKRVVARMVDLTRPEFANIMEAHFPGNPIVPGTIIQEALEQAAILAIAPVVGQDKFGVIMGVDGFRFRRLTKPGEEVLLEADITRLRSSAGKAVVKATVGDQLAVEGEIMFGIADKSKLT